MKTSRVEFFIKNNVFHPVINFNKKSYYCKKITLSHSIMFIFLSFYFTIYRMLAYINTNYAVEKYN